jgi:hypothetical protein
MSFKILKRVGPRYNDRPNEIKGRPANVTVEAPGRRRWRTRGANLIGTGGPNRVSDWPGGEGLMGPPIANSKPHLAIRGVRVFEKRSTGEVKAEGSALAIEDFCCLIPRRGSLPVCSAQGFGPSFRLEESCASTSCNVGSPE